MPPLAPKMDLNSIEIYIKQEIRQRDLQIDQLLYLVGRVSLSDVSAVADISLCNRNYVSLL